MTKLKYLTRDFVVYKGEPFKKATNNFGDVDEEKGWQRFPDYLDGLVDTSMEPKVRRNQDDNE